MPAFVIFRHGPIMVYIALIQSVILLEFAVFYTSFKSDFYSVVAVNSA